MEPFRDLFIFFLLFFSVFTQQVFAAEKKCDKISVAIIEAPGIGISNQQQAERTYAEFHKKLEELDAYNLIDSKIINQVQIQNTEILKQQIGKQESLILLGKLLRVDFIITIKLFYQKESGYFLRTQVYPIKQVELEQGLKKVGIWTYYKYDSLNASFQVTASELSKIHKITLPAQLKFDAFVQAEIPKIIAEVQKSISRLKPLPKRCQLTPFYYAAGTLTALWLVYKIYSHNRPNSDEVSEDYSEEPPAFP